LAALDFFGLIALSFAVGIGEDIAPGVVGSR